jgi:capsule polysaccharide export protein KpsE/RkpR
LAKVESQKSRALVLVGSLQQEVLQVRAQLERAQSRLARVEPARRGLLQRLLGSLVSPRA